MSPPVQVELLGPVRLLVDSRPVPVPGPRCRAVLALLALTCGRTITDTELIDALWADAPPAAAGSSLQSHVSRLRGHLGQHGALLRRAGNGYVLALPADAVDARRVPAEVAQARKLLVDDPRSAATLLEQALGAWRGPALAEFAEVAPLAAEAARFAELRCPCSTT